MILIAGIVFGLMFWYDWKYSLGLLILMLLNNRRLKQKFFEEDR